MTLKDIPRIRWAVDPNEADRLYWAPGRRNPFREDHVFEDAGAPSRFGLYFRRPTRKRAAGAERLYRRHLAACGVVPDGEQLGDLEGILYFTTSDPAAIPEWFKKSPKQQAAARVSGFGSRP